MKRAAGVYQTESKILFCSKAQTVVGLWISIPPYIHLEKNVEVNKIAKALNEVLQASQLNVPHPKQNEWSDLEKKHLAGLGMKSLSALHDKAEYCLVTEDGEELKFSPTENVGSKRGYRFFPEADLTIPRESSPEDIAETLREALNISEQL